MKTLDGTITRLNAAGEKTSISSKCADLDREVCMRISFYKPMFIIANFLTYSSLL